MRFTSLRAVTAVLLATLTMGAAARAQQVSTPPLPERAVRRDIPMTNSIRRAMAAGTRDSTGRPGRNYWQNRTDYSIDVALDPATSRLNGHAVITIRNASPNQLDTVVLRLNPNHFIGTNPRAAPWTPSENTEGMVITRMAIDGRNVNLAAQPPAQGRGGRGGAPPARTEPVLVDAKSTIATLLLSSPIASKSTAKLEIDWNHKLPGAPGRFAHRMSQRWGDTLYQPTQWFPRVAMYDDLRGWDRELYLGPSEFYNEFGTYDVRIDVPAGWIVSGTGVLQNPNEVLTTKARAQLAKVTSTDSITTIVGPEEIGPGQATAQGGANGRLVWRMHADSVNDFAWATAKKFVWSATRATIPGKGVVPVNMLYLPGDAGLYATAGPIARHALEFYSKLWFPYQFPQLTLQDGPSSGMEYPMVINSNAGAADHETGHQWWPMVVSNNETMYGWMDEGFNQYMNILSDADARNAKPVLDGRGQSYGQRSGDEAEAAMMWNANYAGPSSYSFTTYSKTPLMLSALGGVVGDSAVQRAHRDWANAWLFKHPSPWDYMFFMNRALGRDLGWFWYPWLFATESVDGKIEKVTTAGIRTSVLIRQDGQMPSPVVLEIKFAPTGAAIRPMKNMVMTDSVTAVVTYPADVWFSGRRTFTADLVLGRKIESITLDPQRRFPDRNPSDNIWKAGG